MVERCKSLRSNTPKEVLLIAELAEIMKAPKHAENDRGPGSAEGVYPSVSPGKRHCR